MKRKCPACGERELVRILYGYPTSEAFERRAAGEIVLGGCVVDPANPTHQCLACGETVPPTPRDAGPLRITQL